MASRPSVLIMLGLLLASVVSPTIVSADEQAPATVSISFSVENGYVVTENQTISGSIHGVDNIVSAEWTMTRDLGSLVDAGQLTFESTTNDVIDWFLEINPNHFSPCSCVLSVSVDLGEEGDISSSRVLFFEDANSNDSLVALKIYSPLDSDWASNQLEISGWVGESNQNSPTIFSKFNRFQSYAQACEPPSSFDDATIFEYESIDGSFSVEIDISTEPDGWHTLVLFIPEDEMDIDSGIRSIKCIPLKVNNLAPSVTIQTETVFVEGTDFLSINSDVIDPYWETENMYYLWTITHPDERIELIHDTKEINFPRTDSGIYFISLTVMDEGQLTGSDSVTIEIENIQPNAHLKIDGKEVESGASIKLSDRETWLLDATASNDTQNDDAGLRCSWSIDSIPIYEGCSREFSWPEDSGEELVLRLDVMDDDGSFDSISVKLTHPDATEPIPYAIIILVLSALFLVFALVKTFFGREDVGEIPKWKPEK